MYDDGYENIVNVDYSRVCIERMSSIHSGPRPRMAWLEGDVRDMPMFEDSSVDVALDKGTMDAMMTSKGDVWVSSCASCSFDFLTHFSGLSLNALSGASLLNIYPAGAA